MAKNSVEDWDTSPDSNTDVGGVSIAEGCAPGNINNAIRTVMAQVKSYSVDTAADIDAKATLAAVTALFALAAPTGQVSHFLVPPAGWVKLNGGSIGNGASGGTTRANDDTLALYTLLWNNFSNTALPIQTSAGAATTRGASATVDFNANKRMPLFDARTRFLRGVDDGLGFDANIVSGFIQADSLKSHAHAGTTSSDGLHGHGLRMARARDNDPQAGSHDRAGYSTPGSSSGEDDDPIVSAGLHNHTLSINATGDAETRGRAFAAFICVKL